MPQEKQKSENMAPHVSIWHYVSNAYIIFNSKFHISYSKWLDNRSRKKIQTKINSNLSVENKCPYVLLVPIIFFSVLQFT
jgi:hypothetical protein